MSEPPRVLVAAAITLSVVSVSTAAIFFRLTDAPLLVAAFYRLLVATGLLAPFLFLWHRDVLRTLTRRDWMALTGVGIVLGLHFGSWVPSLAFTSVASSVFLVTIHPVFVALWSHFVDREGPGALGWGGILVALGGGAFIAYTDASLAGEALLGDLLAVGGALAAGVYFLAGRRLRQRLPLLAYATPVYAVATLTLLALALLFGDALTGYAPRDYGLFLALALVPMILGHTLINWSLRWVRASVVSTTILGEPVGSTLFALIFLAEAPPAGSLIGGLLVLLGIAAVVQDDQRARRAAAVVPGAD